jgi:four helix bundle protein
MQESILRTTAINFAIEIVHVCRPIQKEQHEYILTRQIIRSATSVGANIHEAQYGESRRDFRHKLRIALKECYETEYWLEIMTNTNYLTEDQHQHLLKTARSLRFMLIKSIRTSGG